MKKNDLYYMQMIFDLAQHAAKQGEVPIAACIVIDDKIYTSYNQRETSPLPYKHAEFLAIEKACLDKKSWRIPEATLYVSIEPCLMCTGMIYQARIKRVVFSEKSPKGGALCFIHANQKTLNINHQVEYTVGTLKNESTKLLKDFFKQRR